MSLLPAMIAMLVASLVAAASACLVQDSALAAARQANRVLAREQAEAALARSAAMLVVRAAGHTGHTEVSPGDIPAPRFSQMGPTQASLHRLTAVGESSRHRVRLQADYAITGCDFAGEPSCRPRVRRIAWRELPAE